MDGVSNTLKHLYVHFLDFNRYFVHSSHWLFRPNRPRLLEGLTPLNVNILVPSGPLHPVQPIGYTFTIYTPSLFQYPVPVSLPLYSSSERRMSSVTGFRGQTPLGGHRVSLPFNHRRRVLRPWEGTTFLCRPRRVCRPTSPCQDGRRDPLRPGRSFPPRPDTWSERSDGG